jgi:hypothetical protein
LCVVLQWDWLGGVMPMRSKAAAAAGEIRAHAA